MTAGGVAARVGIGLGILGVVVVGGGALVVALLSKPRPVGVPGPEAEAAAKAMEDAVGIDAWQRTGVVEWDMGGRAHLWDRERSMDRVRWGSWEVEIGLGDRNGRAWKGGVEVGGKQARKALDNAWAAFCNDAFWLNPVVKLFDDGTTREMVAEPPGLLVRYASGGVTPGDAYLWTKGPDGKPSDVRMWVSVLPLKGIHFTWEGWQQLATGAWVSTDHHVGSIDAVHVTGLRGAAHLADLYPEDPFAPMHPSP